MTSHSRGENICRGHVCKGLLLKTHQETLKTLQEENEQYDWKWAKDLNRHLTTEDILMENKNVKIYLTSYVVRKFQIKAMMKYYCTPIRMIRPQNIDTTKCQWGRGATETHSLLVGMQSGTDVLEDTPAISFFFLSFVLRYNWQAALYKFKGTA